MFPCRVGAGLAIGMLSLIALGCSSMTVKHDYDPQVDFTRYQTYSWLHQKIESTGGTFGGNPRNYERIQKAVNEELDAGGYTRDDDSPDFLVVIHGGVQDRINVQTLGYGYGYLRYWGVPQMELQRYAEGTLIIDFVDSESKNLIWRGWATDALEPSSDPVGDIYNAVHKIMKNWPPS